MKKASALALLASLVILACGKAKIAEPELKTEDDKTLYALGLVVSDNLATFKLSEAELEVVKAGLGDGVLHRTRKVDISVYGPKLQNLAQARANLVSPGEKKDVDASKIAGSTFLQKAAGEKGAVKSPTGFVLQEITPGKGASPKPTDKVKVHYRGTLIDGTVFDSSIDRGQPVELPLNGVIPCWGQALPMMKVGGKSRLICPPELAYGDHGAPPKIKPGSTLVFEVELLDIVK
jgi:FKBP-type peptidyl-prolyl cis-trans isomerase FkpA